MLPGLEPPVPPLPYAWLHLFRRRNAEQGQAVLERLGVACDELQAYSFTCVTDHTVMLVKTVECLGEFIQIGTDVVRHEFGRSYGYRFVVHADLSYQRPFIAGEVGKFCRVIKFCIRLAENTLGTGMCVLQIWTAITLEGD